MNNTFILAFSTLTGTIIGAGIFALPFAVQQSGIIPALFYFAFLGGIVLLLHLFMGEITLRTKEKHRLTGYAEIYLGNWGKIVVVFSTVIIVVGTLLAYMIIGGEFLAKALLPFFSAEQDVMSLLLWGAMSFFILRGIQLIAKAEFFMNIMLVLIIGVILFFALPHVEGNNISAFNERGNVFLPFGIILFAFAGWQAIPEIAALFRGKKEKRSLDNVIVWASIAVALVYMLFSILVIGASGIQTSDDALTGLQPKLGDGIITMGALFGIIAIAASYLILGNYLKNSLRYDFKLPYILAAALAVIAPLILFLSGVRSFIDTLELVGIIIGVVEGVLIVLIFQRAKKQGNREPEYSINIPKAVPYLVATILVVGSITVLTSKLF